MSIKNLTGLSNKKYDFFLSSKLKRTSSGYMTPKLLNDI